MVFRIADKKRDKKVTANSFAEILKRVKLRMSEVETSQLMNLITRGNQNVQYDEYLQCLSAFQINSEKYPLKSSRTYVQLCLLKFGSEAQSYKDADKLYREMNAKEDLPYLSFENYVTFVRKNLQKMDEFETIAVFVGLDVNSECQVEKSIFRREIGKAFSIVERGVNL
jgi:Ca2+-binding EF-hand superfamily protein